MVFSSPPDELEMSFMATSISARASHMPIFYERGGGKKNRSERYVVVLRQMAKARPLSACPRCQ
jgi:hypothetical protein